MARLLSSCDAPMVKYLKLTLFQLYFKKRAIYTNDSYSSNNVGDIVPAGGSEGTGNH